jgi:hypothetical protein
MTFWDGFLLGSFAFWMGCNWIYLLFRSRYAADRLLARSFLFIDVAAVTVTLVWLVYGGRFAPS